MSANVSSLQLASAHISLLAEPDKLIIVYCASSFDNLISSSYSMPAFSANLLWLFSRIFEFDFFSWKNRRDHYCIFVFSIFLFSRLFVIFLISVPDFWTGFQTGFLDRILDWIFWTLDRISDRIFQTGFFWTGYFRTGYFRTVFLNIEIIDDS